MQWPLLMYITRDTKPGLGAPLSLCGKRGFGRELFPTLHLMQELVNMDLTVASGCFVVPARSAMYVLLRFNTHEDH